MECDTTAGGAKCSASSPDRERGRPLEILGVFHEALLAASSVVPLASTDIAPVVVTAAATPLLMLLLLLLLLLPPPPPPLLALTGIAVELLVLLDKKLPAPTRSHKSRCAVSTNSSGSEPIVPVSVAANDSDEFDALSEPLVGAVAPVLLANEAAAVKPLAAGKVAEAEGEDDEPLASNIAAVGLVVILLEVVATMAAAAAALDEEEEGLVPLCCVRN